MRFPFRAWLAASCVACSSAPPAGPKVPPAPVVATGPSLYEELRAVERPGPPLEALPDWARARLLQVAAGLTDVDRERLVLAEDESARGVPLLHWAAGGTSLAVYSGCLDASVLSDDWTSLAATNDPPPSPSELVEIANELGRRVARYVLRERAADFAPGREPSTDAFRQVVLAAQLLGERELAGRFAEAWALRDDSADAGFALLRTRVQLLDTTGAGEVLDRLRGQAARDPRWPSAERALAAAHLAASGESDPLVRARALNGLELHDEALRVLEPGGVTGLARTTEALRAELRGGPCPGVLLPNGVLCRAAFAARGRELGLRARLLDAWQTGVGRDPTAVEHFLGLAFVTGLTYQLGDDGGALTGDGFQSALEAFRTHAEAAKEVHPRFEALALIAETLRAAMLAALQANGGQRGTIAEERRRDLRSRALDLVERLPGEDWARDALLAALAVSLQDDTIAGDLTKLREGPARGGLATLASLELWTALADGDAQRLASLSEILVQITETTDAEADARSRWLLTWAEAEARLRPGEETRETLWQLSQRLARPEVPLALRLRAELDSAALDHGAGRSNEARARLRAVIEQVPRSSVDTAEAQDFLVVVTGYHQILRGLDPALRRDALNELEALLTPLREHSAASPSVLSWLGLWQSELQRREQEAGCKGRRQCVAKARALHQRSLVALDGALGPRTAQLFASGVLPMGGAEIDLRYGQAGELQPRVSIDVAFPVVPVPVE